MKATINYTTRTGRVVSQRMTRTNALYRLACLDKAEANCRLIAPTDSGDVRFNDSSEAAAIRAAFPEVCS